MNRFRSHIARLLVIILICSGFALHMAQPVQVNQSSNEFARWLSTMTKSSNSAGLQEELDKLKKSGAHLDKIIEKASQIVVRNNEQFNFSFNELTASQHVYKLLLIEWSQFQTGNAMASVPAQQVAKSFLPANMDKFGAFGSASILTSKPVFPTWLPSRNLIDQTISSIAVVPMSGGIAIGAP